MATKCFALLFACCVLHSTSKRVDIRKTVITEGESDSSRASNFRLSFDVWRVFPCTFWGGWNSKDAIKFEVAYGEPNSFQVTNGKLRPDRSLQSHTNVLTYQGNEWVTGLMSMDPAPRFPPQGQRVGFDFTSGDDAEEHEFLVSVRATQPSYIGSDFDCGGWQNPLVVKVQKGRKSLQAVFHASDHFTMAGARITIESLDAVAQDEPLDFDDMQQVDGRSPAHVVARRPSDGEPEPGAAPSDCSQCAQIMSQQTSSATSTLDEVMTGFQNVCVDQGFSHCPCCSDEEQANILKPVADRLKREAAATQNRAGEMCYQFQSQDTCCLRNDGSLDTKSGSCKKSKGNAKLTKCKESCAASSEKVIAMSRGTFKCDLYRGGEFHMLKGQGACPWNAQVWLDRMNSGRMTPECEKAWKPCDPAADHGCQRGSAGYQFFRGSPCMAMPVSPASED